MTAANVDDGPISERGARAIEVARWATVVTACSVMVSPPLANAAMAVMLVALLASGQAAARLRHACTQPLGIGTVALIAVIAAAMLWAEVPWSERWSSFWSWRKLWMIPIALALMGPFQWKLRLVVAYVGLCGVAVLISFGVVVVTGKLPTTVYDFAGSMLRNHSAQSMAFAAVTFLALWLASDIDLPKRWRLTAAVFAALFVLNMGLVTPGRSGFLALAVMLAVLAAFNLSNFRVALASAVVVVLLAGAIAASPLARGRLALGWNEWQNATTLGYKSSMGIRAVIYENTFEIVKQHPWLGTGTGGFGAAYTAQVKDKYTDWRVLPTVDPHSQYLFFLAEQGIVGLVAFLAFIVLALVDRGDGSRARIAAIGLLLGWCATSLFSSHFKTFAEGHLLTVMLGALLARPIARLDPTPRA